MVKFRQLLVLTGATFGFIIIVFLLHNVFPVIENIFYDMNFFLNESESPESVVIVGIDSKSTNDIGTWPWPRSMLADLFEKIESGSPNAVALDFLFAKKLNDPGSDSLRAVFSRMSNLVIGMRAESVTDNAGSLTPVVDVEAYKHRFMILKHQESLPDFFDYAAGKFLSGDQSIATHADRAGFLNVSTSRSSQNIRELVHVIQSGKEYYPSFGLAATAAYLDLKPNEFVLDGDGYIILRDKKVRMKRGVATVRLNFKGKAGTIQTISAADVLNNTYHPQQFEDKLVFIGITDAPSAPSDFFITPAGTQFPGVELWATAAADLINGTWIKTSNALFIGNWFLVLLIFPGFVLVFPGKRKKWGILLSLAFVFFSIGAGFYLMNHTGYFWNSGFHIYAWIALMIWLATQKSEIIITGRSILRLEPEGAVKKDSLQPPTVMDYIQELPSTETAAFVIKHIKPKAQDPNAVFQNVDSTLVESEDGLDASNSLYQESPTQSVMEEFSKLANGRIIKLLGVGGMADVYLVWHPRMEVYRAIKVIKPGQPQQWLDRFETEIKIFANLNHPNIVQCYGVGDWYTLPYLEMEYVTGAALEDVLKKCNSFTPIETLAIGVLVCKALQYAHKQVVTVYGETYEGIIHRDLKPANILLSRGGHIKLTDFGIARPGKVSLHTMDSGKVVGTLPYLAPEQLDGKGLSLKTDIYALGATLYEMVSGTRAYPQLEVTSIVSAKSKGNYQPLRVTTSLPKELVDIISKAMESNPDRRFSSAAEMGESLEKALQSLVKETDTFILSDLVSRSFR